MQKLYLVNPFDGEQVRRIQEFEEEQGIHTDTMSFLERIQSSCTEEEYQWRKKNKNEIEEDLIIEKDSKVIDSCHIYGEKDMKRCRISFAPIKRKSRKLIALATEYSTSTLGMEEVFIKVSPEDESLLSLLGKENFENLGEESGSILFLKEKEADTEKGSNYENNQKK